MSLVKNDGGVVGNHTTILVAADAEIRKKEMVIADDDVRSVRPRPHPRDKTRLEIRTLLTEANFRTGIDTVPERNVVGKIRQLATIADRCLVDPATNLVEMVHFIESLEDRLVLGLPNAVKA